MRLATIPATLWPAPEPRSRIVLYAWYPPAAGTEEMGSDGAADTHPHDADCTSRTDRDRSGLR